ncbi:unnamed protein product [Menidia menidia]|uniref:(Atlantic silverside) hypothetical protein n=1 Tax=Menidia menidia TaxID=238744 RepID=A0A8S4BXK8_9TELE|nr:unnamed protein product [Menidia menidia]
MNFSSSLVDPQLNLRLAVSEQTPQSVPIGSLLTSESSILMSDRQTSVCLDVVDPLAHPSVAPSIPTPSTLHPLLTIIETTKESLSEATEAGARCLSDRGGADWDDEGLVISGYGSGKAFKSYRPQPMLKIFVPDLLPLDYRHASNRRPEPTSGHLCLHTLLAKRVKTPS